MRLVDYPYVSKKFEQYDIILVGSGLFNLTIACLLTADKFDKVLMLEKRAHLGGNSYSEFDPRTGIEIHKYGTHIFHTNQENVWKFVNRYEEFVPYQHKVFASLGQKKFPLPINLLTLEMFFERSFTPKEAELFFKNLKLQSSENNQSFESVAISKIGKELYKSFIRGYTKKQWQIDPKELPPEVFTRLPIRNNYNSNYFDDQFQGLPKHGYQSLISNMLSECPIDVVLDTDWDRIHGLQSSNQIVVYTGPIDSFFQCKYGRLKWRTLDFEIERIGINDYQGNSVINFPDESIPYTRIHEFKHLHPQRMHTKGETIIMREFSRFAREGDEPFYPVNSTDDRTKLILYRNECKKLNRTIFGGRLGSYKYLDMHMAIASAFQVYSNHIRPKLVG